MAEEKKNMPTVDDQYQRLIEARNFHYENLNKWLTFFYVAIAAIFAGFCTLHTHAASIKLELIVMMALYLISICAYLSCKGYYYWETNWIMLVHRFERKYFVEEDPEMRVYSVMVNKIANNCISDPTKGANVSTTKVALVVTWLLAMLWGALSVYLVIKLLQCTCFTTPCCKIVVSILASFVLTQLMAFIGAKCLPSDLSGLDDLSVKI